MRLDSSVAWDLRWNPHDVLSPHPTPAQATQPTPPHPESPSRACTSPPPPTLPLASRPSPAFAPRHPEEQKVKIWGKDAGGPRWTGGPARETRGAQKARGPWGWAWPRPGPRRGRGCRARRLPGIGLGSGRGAGPGLGQLLPARRGPRPRWRRWLRLRGSSSTAASPSQHPPPRSAQAAGPRPERGDARGGGGAPSWAGAARA